MIINEEEALSRVNSPDNLTNKLKDIKSNIIVERLPQSDGPRNIPPKVQQIIGVTSALTSSRDAAAAFGVSHPMANNYANGETKATKNVVAERVATAHENALDAMLSSIALVKDRLADPDLKIKPTDLSKIAADMGRVIEKTSPKEGTGTRVQVLVYAPRMKSESEFEEIST